MPRLAALRSSLARLASVASLTCVACVARPSPQPGESSQAPLVFAEHDNATESECSSLLGPGRTLFAGRLELQLPVGVEPLVEVSPSLLHVRDSRASCVGARTIAMIVVVERQDDDPNLPISFARDQLLDLLALPNGLEITTREEDDATRRMTSVIHVPADPEYGERPSRILLGLRGGAGRLYVVMFETSLEQFDALLPSFDAALASVRIVE